MLDVIKTHSYSLKLIVAAIRNKKQVVNVAKLGAQAITIPEVAFREFIADLPETNGSLIQFDNDWSASGKSLDR